MLGKILEIVVAEKIHYNALNEMFKELDHYHFLLCPERVNEYTQTARTIEQLNSYTLEQGKILFIARIGEDYVGFINLKIEIIESSYLSVGRKFFLIDNIFVCDNYRNRGVATYLVNHAKEWCLEQGVNKIELQVFSSNTSALQFYESIGFNLLSVRMELKINE
ncbi:MAG: family N-acetyltransferase [Segetibacter sp.]|nr:family N-acetyltransferase [Segetibacter sp.]